MVSGLARTWLYARRKWVSSRSALQGNGFWEFPMGSEPFQTFAIHSLYYAPLQLI